MTNRSLATVLFTDIVGSTERAAELRDAGWRDLRQEHDRRVRREIRRFGGHEINTAGDSFLTTFERPAQAIGCADAIRTAVRELGLEVRAGLHMGELEGAGRELGGLALNIGARVAAEAGPGEILVSRSVHDALAGSQFDFEDRSVRALKGVPGEWRLFAVTNVPADTYEAPSRGWLPEFTARHKKVGVGVLGFLAVVGGVRLATRDSSRIDPEAALAAGAAPGIAVMPFQVADPDLAVWREGLVDLLTANLDGIGGLRAIDSRTVLAQWHEGVPEGQVPDLRAILNIAHDAGGSYAVVGSAVTIGRSIRLSAEIYEPGTGPRDRSGAGRGPAGQPLYAGRPSLARGPAGDPRGGR